MTQTINKTQAMFHYRNFMREMGLDITNGELEDTPRRVVDMFEAMFSGSCTSPEKFLDRPLPTSNDDLSVFKVPFVSLCPHHLMPFVGTCYLAIIPDGKIIGFSKYMSLVKCVARKPILQEQLANDIANLIDNAIHPTGVMVIIKGTHLCTIVPGVYDFDSGIVQQPEFNATTSVVRGLFRKDNKSKGLSAQAARAEVFELIKLKHFNTE
jgi:GTP cyclohydrolase I